MNTARGWLRCDLPIIEYHRNRAALQKPDIGQIGAIVATEAR